MQLDNLSIIEESRVYITKEEPACSLCDLLLQTIYSNHKPLVILQLNFMEKCKLFFFNKWNLCVQFA